MMFKEQAENCRQQANDFAGRPEAPFLLRVASAFDELAIDRERKPMTGASRSQRMKAAPPLSA
jgi:hypothetical protein